MNIIIMICASSSTVYKFNGRLIFKIGIIVHTWIKMKKINYYKIYSTRLNNIKV